MFVCLFIYMQIILMIHLFPQLRVGGITGTYITEDHIRES